MTHRQLAEKYAKQFHDATRTIMELETEVADVKIRLEQTAAVNEGLNKQGDDSGTIRDQLNTAMLHIKELEHTATSHQDQLKAKQNDAGAVAKELDAAALQIRELEHAVTGYHDQLKAKQSDADAVAKDHNAAVLQIKELEHTIASYQDRLKAKQSNADALAKGFQEQRTVARAFREGCEANHSDFDRLLQERAVADARVQELERKIAADSRYPGTRARIHATVRNSRELRAEISDLKNQLTIARNNHDAAIVELRVSKKDRANLRRQTTNADSLNYSLEIKVATLTHVVDHVQRNLSHKEAEVKKIGGLLDREMKRRRDAEATPSSDHWKRSKKCDIEIVGVEQDGVLEAVITQPNRLQRSHHQEAAATHDTSLPLVAVGATTTLDQSCTATPGPTQIEVHQPKIILRLNCNKQ